MQLKKIYLIKTFVYFVILFLGYTLPTRHYFYPFVKFPMYGYSKTKNKMYKKFYSTTLFFNNGDSIKIKPIDYGYTGGYYNKVVSKPFINGDLTAVDKLIDNVKLIHPKKLHKVKITKTIFQINNKGLEKKMSNEMVLDISNYEK